ncbi:hypothetical protein HMPREF9715_02866, partial [Myroides odoratimimus CIP 101113]
MKAPIKLGAFSKIWDILLIIKSFFFELSSFFCYFFRL